MAKILILAVLFASGLTACGALYPVPPTKVGASSASPGSLSIRSIELEFDNGRAQITVPYNGRLVARATIQVEGTGVLRAAWLVDDTVVELITRPLVHGDVLKLQSAGTTMLPTFSPGKHSVRIRIDEPQTAMTLPVIFYTVVNEAVDGGGQ